MRNKITFLMVMLVSIINAQDYINYQAAIRDGSGDLLVNTFVGIQFSILQSTSTGIVSYTETHSVNTNTLGMVNIELGGGTPVIGQFSGINWEIYDHFLKVEINTGSGYVHMGTSQMNYVPYAHYATLAEEAVYDNDNQTLSLVNVSLSISGGNSVDIPAGSALWNANKLNGNDVSTLSPSIYDVLKWTGTSWAPGTDEGTTYLMGDGLTLSGSTINSTWIATGNSIRNTNLLYVGIGVTNPVDKLHVEGVNSASYLRITRPDFGSSSLDGLKLGYNNAGLAYLWNYENTNLNFATNNAIAMTIQTTGNVGIGIANPVDKLHVHGTDTQSYLRITRPSSGTSTTDGLSLGFNSSAVAYLLNYENTNLNIGTNALTHLTIENSGDVGIGTSYPTSRLHIAGTSGLDPFRIQIAGTTKLMVHDNGGLGIGYSTFAPPVDGLLVDGDIAVGLTTPVNRFHLTSATSTSESLMRFTRGTTGLTSADGIVVGYSSNGTNYIWGYENNQISIATNGSFRMTIQSDGDVGIGTSSPSYDLQLGANSAAKPTSSAWTVISDARLKDEAASFDDGLDLVMQIRPILFKYNGKIGLPTDETGVGTMAQELQKIAPYMVKSFVYTEGSSAGPEETVINSGRTEEYLAVDYGAMDFVLVNAVKELKQQLDEQQKLIQELQNKIATLQNK